MKLTDDIVWMQDLADAQHNGQWSGNHPSIEEAWHRDIENLITNLEDLRILGEKHGGDLNRNEQKALDAFLPRLSVNFRKIDSWSAGLGQTSTWSNTFNEIADDCWKLAIWTSRSDNRAQSAHRNIVVDFADECALADAPWSKMTYFRAVEMMQKPLPEAEKRKKHNRRRRLARNIPQVNQSYISYNMNDDHEDASHSMTVRERMRGIVRSRSGYGNSGFGHKDSFIVYAIATR